MQFVQIKLLPITLKITRNGSEDNCGTLHFIIHYLMIYSFYVYSTRVKNFLITNDFYSLDEFTHFIKILIQLYVL